MSRWWRHIFITKCNHRHTNISICQIQQSRSSFVPFSVNTEAPETTSPPSLLLSGGKQSSRCSLWHYGPGGVSMRPSRPAPGFALPTRRNLRPCDHTPPHPVLGNGLWGRAQRGGGGLRDCEGGGVHGETDHSGAGVSLYQQDFVIADRLREQARSHVSDFIDATL